MEGGARGEESAAGARAQVVVGELGGGAHRTVAGPRREGVLGLEREEEVVGRRRRSWVTGCGSGRRQVYGNESPDRRMHAPKQKSPSSSGTPVSTLSPREANLQGPKPNVYRAKHSIAPPVNRHTTAITDGETNRTG